mgnify:CR=1 FL=1
MTIAFEQKTASESLKYLKEKINNTLIGLIYLKKIDWKKKEAELAYAIAKKTEGKGYMTQSVKKISDWAFNKHQLKTLQIIVHKTNFGSIRVAEKVGFTWQKVLVKEHTPPGEKPLDMELYERYACHNV